MYLKYLGICGTITLKSFRTPAHQRNENMQTELKGFVRPHAVSCRAGLHPPASVSHNKRATRMISGAKGTKVEKDLHATGTQQLELTLLFDANHLADVTRCGKKMEKERCLGAPKRS
jgi:hypothetical protein